MSFWSYVEWLNFQLDTDTRRLPNVIFSTVAVAVAVNGKNSATVAVAEASAVDIGVPLYYGV